MHWFARAVLLFALIACNVPRASDGASAAAEALTRQHAAHALRASVAGSDCRVLLISIQNAFDRNLVESIHYGTDGYEAFGGVEQFAHDRGFRAVVYRDANGGLRTYGATSRDEARSLPRCR
jgi:hypothetical protein